MAKRRSVARGETYIRTGTMTRGPTPSDSTEALDEDTFLDLAAMTVCMGFDAGAAIDVINANRAHVGLPPLEVHPATLRAQLRRRQVSAGTIRAHGLSLLLLVDALLATVAGAAA